MKLEPEYIKEFIPNLNADIWFAKLKTLNWLSETQNRREYFMADEVLQYTYSERTYTSMVWEDLTYEYRNTINKKFNTDYNVCFLNKYDSYRDSLGWHSDDSPEMDTAHPICVLSLGQERELYWRSMEKNSKINKILLGHGSLFIMPAHFQESYLHKIPKHSSQVCDTRISLTFRRYIKV